MLIYRTKLLNVAVVLVSIYLFLPLMAPNAKAQVQACGDSVLTRARGSNTLDAECRCAPTQCRLSLVGSPDFARDEQGSQNKGILGNAHYMCVDGTEDVYSGDGRLNGGGDQAMFSAIKQISAANDQHAPQSNDTPIQSEFYKKFYVDEFNKNPAAQNIPDGAVCRIVDSGGVKRAFWYNPNYFQDLNKNNPFKLSECTPILVQKDLWGNQAEGVDTFFGCLPASLNGLVAFVVRLLVGFAGIITFIIVLLNLYKIIGNATNPDVVSDSRKKLTSAIITFIVLLSSITILSIIGVEILDLESMGGGLFRIFTGG